MRSDVNKGLISVYYITWIFIGNFILLNLFLAILLDSFLEEKDQNEEDANEHNEKEKAKKPEKKDKKKEKKDKK